MAGLTPTGSPSILVRVYSYEGLLVALGDAPAFRSVIPSVLMTASFTRRGGLSNTDTVLLYNGEDHYDSFVPYEGVILPPVDED